MHSNPFLQVTLLWLALDIPKGLQHGRGGKGEAFCCHRSEQNKRPTHTQVTHTCIHTGHTDTHCTHVFSHTHDDTHSHVNTHNCTCHTHHTHTQSHTQSHYATVFACRLGRGWEAGVGCRGTVGRHRQAGIRVQDLHI